MHRVKMFNPGVGTIEVSPPAVRVYEANGWVQIEGARRVAVAAADGSTLTTGTVFPAETFDDEPVSSTDTASEPAAEAPTHRARKGTTEGDK